MEDEFFDSPRRPTNPSPRGSFDLSENEDLKINLPYKKSDRPKTARPKRPDGISSTNDRRVKIEIGDNSDGDSPKEERRSFDYTASNSESSISSLSDIESQSDKRSDVKSRTRKVEVYSKSMRREEVATNQSSMSKATDRTALSMLTEIENFKLLQSILSERQELRSRNESETRADKIKSGRKERKTKHNEKAVLDITNSSMNEERNDKPQVAIDNFKLLQNILSERHEHNTRKMNEHTANENKTSSRSDFAASKIKRPASASVRHADEYKKPSTKTKITDGKHEIRIPNPYEHSDDEIDSHSDQSHDSHSPRSKPISKLKDARGGAGDNKPEMMPSKGKIHAASSSKSAQAWKEEHHSSSDDSRSDKLNSTFTITERRNETWSKGQISRSRRSHSSDEENLDHSQDRRRRKSYSSEWSTGSDEERLTTKESARSRPVRRSSGSSVSVSSLSETEEVESKVIQKSTAKVRGELSDSVDKDKLNLQLILSALLDTENNKEAGKKTSATHDSGPESSSTRQRSNYSFSNDRARTIDLENQRLLKKLLAQEVERNNATTKTKSSSKHQQEDQRSKVKKRSDPVRVTHSTVNRMREQQRVERENLALLRRLNKIKPSADLNRSKQLEEYNRQMSYHCPQMRTVRVPAESSQSRNSNNSSASTGRRSRPTSANYSRPSSAKSAMAYMSPVSTGRHRPASASNRSDTQVKVRPEWETGW